ncbi:MAG TPA: hypothetical protein VGM56_00320 [Byssovorax sp.]|jgi:hypothetical protein
MREFECSDEKILVRRGVIDAFVAAFGPYKGRGERVVCRHLGVETIGGDPEAWFSASRFLAAMAELQDQFGSAFMRKVGSFIFDKAVFPPGIDAVTKGMELIHTAYHMNHSADAKGRIGGYHWVSMGDRAGTMTCDNPYPCAFDVGIIETIARRFESAAHVLHVPGGCRHDGAEACQYKVEW